MKIEITEETIKLNVDGKLVNFVKGDVSTVSDEVGNICLGHGWAKDVDGVVETGERKPGANGPLVPDKVNQKAQKVG